MTEDFDHETSPDSHLILRCTGCGCLYLSPAPAEDELGRIYPPRYFASPEVYASRQRRSVRPAASTLAQWCGGLAPHARILDVGCGTGQRLHFLRGLCATWYLQGVELSETAVQIARQTGLDVHHGRLEALSLPRGQYDLVLLIHTLEHALDPVTTLKSVHSLLQPGGQAVALIHNLASPSFALFGGRHWGAYDVPRQRRLFSAGGLRRLAANAGLQVTSLSTLPGAATWLRSARRLLRDWAAPGWLVRRFGENSSAMAMACTALETLHQVRGKGALVVATFRRLEADG